jgi:hypothetical protein
MGWFLERAEIFSSPVSRLSLRPIQSVPGAKQVGHEANHSPPSSAEVKIHDVFKTYCLIKHTDTFTFQQIWVCVQATDILEHINYYFWLYGPQRTLAFFTTDVHSTLLFPFAFTLVSHSQCVPATSICIYSFTFWLVWKMFIATLVWSILITCSNHSSFLLKSATKLGGYYTVCCGFYSNSLNPLFTSTYVFMATCFSFNIVPGLRVCSSDMCGLGDRVGLDQAKGSSLMMHMREW